LGLWHPTVLQTRLRFVANPATSAIPDPPGFERLSKPEQISYLQQLWDRISACPEEIPVPASHIALLEDRLAAHRQAPEAAKPAYEVIDRLRDRKR
jgi:putative addiction module component (TIGR02574 family)